MKENNSHSSKGIPVQSPIMDIIREDGEEGEAEQLQQEPLPAPPTMEPAVAPVQENTVQQAVYLQRTTTAPAVLQQHTIPIVPARPILRDEESANLTMTTIIPEVSRAGVSRQTTMSQALELQAGINELMRQVITSVSSQRVTTTQLNDESSNDHETIPLPPAPLERASTTAGASVATSTSSTHFSNENTALNDTETSNITEQEAQIASKMQRKRRCMFVSFPILLLCVVAGIVVAVTVPRDNNDSSSTAPSSSNNNNTFCSNKTNAWQLYQEIVGETPNLGLGKSVSLSGGAGGRSSNVTRLAVGMIWANNNGDNSGEVRVYDVNTNIAVGQNLYGVTEGRRFGSSVSLSEDGNFLAVGSPGRALNFDACGSVRVLRWQSSSSTWVAIGQDGIGPPASLYEEFGAAVALSGQGDRVVVGEPASSYQGLTNRGAVRVYSLQTSDGEEVWVQTGQTFFGSAANESLGSSVAISSDGSVFASISSSGVRVLQYDGSNWTALGSSIVNKKHTLYYFGGSIALSANASTLAIGAPFAPRRGNASASSGNVQVFRWDGTDWTAAGKDIYGYHSYDAWGSSVALSDDGNTLAAGASAYADSEGRGTGQAYNRVFKWNESLLDWNQIGIDISSDQKRDQLASVTLSGDGSILAIGGFGYDNNIGFDTGRVRVFRRNEDIQGCGV